MSPTLFVLPCALLISLLVGKMGLIALDLPVTGPWIIIAATLCALLLYRRNIAELGVITILTGLVEVHSFTVGGVQVAPDVLLAVLVAVISLPLILDIMGLTAPKLGPLLSS